MKKFTFFFIAMAAAFSGHAQFEQGRKLVGGSVSFTTNTDKSNLAALQLPTGSKHRFLFLPILVFSLSTIWQYEQV